MEVFGRFQLRFDGGLTVSVVLVEGCGSSLDTSSDGENMATGIDRERLAGCPGGNP